MAWTDTVTQASFDAESNRTTLTLSTGGLTPAAEKGKVCTFTDGAPEHDHCVTDNAASTLVVRGDATGESGTHVSVDDFGPVISERRLALDELELLRKWAKANL